METNFIPMNEEYKNKHYPNGSVFSAIDKTTKKSSIALYIFLFPFLVAFGAGTIFSAKMLIDTIAAGENDMISAGIFVVGFCLVMFAVCLLSVLVTKKRNSLGAEGLIKKSVKNSKCDESDIREFEQQAMASDSFILALTEKYKAKLNGQRDGIMTRDYIFLADNLNIVMKYSDIVAAFLVQRTVYINVNNKSKRIDSLTISLLSNKNVQTFVDTSIEAGTELLSILKEKNPQIETKSGSVLQEKEFDTYCKGFASSHI